MNFYCKFLAHVKPNIYYFSLKVAFCYLFSTFCYIFQINYRVEPKNKFVFLQNPPEPIEGNKWWWNLPVSSIHFSKPTSLSKGSTCEDAINLLQEGKFHQLPIVDQKNEILGFVSLNGILSSLISGKAVKTDSAEKIMSNQYRKVVLSTSLGRLSRMLEQEHFAVILDEHNDGAFVGIASQIDLLEFINKGQTSNGEVHANGTKCTAVNSSKNGN